MLSCLVSRRFFASTSILRLLFMLLPFPTSLLNQTKSSRNLSLVSFLPCCRYLPLARSTLLLWIPFFFFFFFYFNLGSMKFASFYFCWLPVPSWLRPRYRTLSTMTLVWWSCLLARDPFCLAVSFFDFLLPRAVNVYLWSARRRAGDSPVLHRFSAEFCPLFLLTVSLSS